MPQIAATVRAVPASGIRRIFELAAGLDDVIQLSVGEPEVTVAGHGDASGPGVSADESQA